MEWYQSEEILQRFVFLKYTNHSWIKSMLEVLHPKLNLERVKLAYPALEMVLFQGPKQDLELIEQFIRHLDQYEDSSVMES